MTAVRPDEHLLGVLELHASCWADEVAFEHYGSFDMGSLLDAITYAELSAEVQTLGAALAGIVEPGARVALVFHAGIDFVRALLAVFAAGAVAVPVPVAGSFSSHSERLDAILADCSPAVVLTDEAQAVALEERLRHAAVELRVVALQSLQLLGPGDVPERDLDSVAFLQFTSGSTGNPKGVVVTHRNLMSNLALIQGSLRGGRHTRVMGWIPHIHDMGLVGHLLWSLAAAAPCAIVPSLEFAKRPVRWLQMMSDGGFVGTAAPNSAYDLVARLVTDEHLATMDLSRWEIALNGAEPVRAQTIERFSRRFADAGFDAAAFVPAYGLAEATLFVTCGAPGEAVITRRFDTESLWQGVAVDTDAVDGTELVSSGTVAGRGVIICDGNGAEVRDGVLGSIRVHGGSVTNRYWGRDEERTELDTGDIGVVVEGELFVTGRRKDLVIVNGRNIAPTDVEEAVASIAQPVRPDGVAVHQADLIVSDRVVVAVELRPSSVVEHGWATCRGEIASMLSRSFGIVRADIIAVRPGQIPRTSSGKVQRSKTHRLLLDGVLEPLYGELGGSRVASS